MFFYLTAATLILLLFFIYSPPPPFDASEIRQLYVVLWIVFTIIWKSNKRDLNRTASSEILNAILIVFVSIFAVLFTLLLFLDFLFSRGGGRDWFG